MAAASEQPPASGEQQNQSATDAPESGQQQNTGGGARGAVRQVVRDALHTGGGVRDRVAGAGVAAANRALDHAASKVAQTKAASVAGDAASTVAGKTAEKAAGTASKTAGDAAGKTASTAAGSVGGAALGAATNKLGSLAERQAAKKTARRQEHAAETGTKPAKAADNIDTLAGKAEAAARIGAGAAKGGWAGAGIEAAKVVLENPKLRRRVLTIAAVIGLPPLLAQLVVTLVIPSIAIAAIFSTFAGESTSAMESDGVSTAAIEAGIDTSSNSDLPQEIVAWIAENKPDRIDYLDAVNNQLTTELPNLTDRDLRNGAETPGEDAEDTTGLRLGDSDEQVAAQERTEAGWIAALQVEVTVTKDDGSTSQEPFLSEQDAQAAFDQARQWALGIATDTCTDTGSTGSGGQAAQVDATQEEIAQIIYSVLADWGMSDVNIAGILGNWQQESGLDPTAVFGIEGESHQIGPQKQALWDNDNFAGTGAGTDHGPIGLGQFTNGRTLALLTYADSKQMDWYDLYLQLAFVVQGDNTEDIASFKDYVTTPRDSVEDITHEFQYEWERAGGQADQQRIDYANEWAKRISGWSIQEDEVAKVEAITGPDPITTDNAGEGGGVSVESCDTGTSFAGDVTHPLGESWTTTDGYGMRLHPVYHYWKLHAGTDYVKTDGATAGAEIYAIADGTVVTATTDGEISGWGNVVAYELSDGTLIWNAHLQEGGVKVQVGDKVKRGQVVGLVGETGPADGPHLHFGVYKAGSNTTYPEEGNATDPEDWLAEHMHGKSAEGADLTD